MTDRDMTNHDRTGHDLFGHPAGSGPGIHQGTLCLSFPSARAGGPSLTLQVLKGSGRNDTPDTGREFPFSCLEDPAINALGERWALALRKRYPQTHTAKHVARAFGCEVGTAKKWLSGQVPHAAKLLQAGRLHGAGFIFEVCLPGTDAERLGHLYERLDELEKALKTLGDDLVILRGEDPTEWRRRLTGPVAKDGEG